MIIVGLCHLCKSGSVGVPTEDHFSRGLLNLFSSHYVVHVTRPLDQDAFQTGSRQNFARIAFDPEEVESSLEQLQVLYSDDDEFVIIYEYDFHEGFILHLLDKYPRNPIVLVSEQSLGLSELPLRLDSLIFTYEPESGTLEEHYKAKNGPLISGRVGNWNIQTRSWRIPEREMWQRRTDLGGATITASVLPWDNIINIE